MDWAKHFESVSRKEVTFGTSFGSDASNAILAYRQLWDPYVTSTVKAARAASAAMTDVANRPGNEAQNAALLQIAEDYQTDADSLLSMWNMYAGQSMDQITTVAKSVINTFQQAVALAQDTWAKEKALPLHAMPIEMQLPLPNSVAQTNVNAKVNSAINSASTLGLSLTPVTSVPGKVLTAAEKAADAAAKAAPNMVLEIAVAIGAVAIAVAVLASKKL